MTTIGYGDRGPKTQSEIVFVMVAEFVGLAFFAILLTQINTVNAVMNEAQRVRAQIIRHARIHSVGKSQPCMVSKARINCTGSERSEEWSRPVSERA